jgi:hypothetical protein
MSSPADRPEDGPSPTRPSAVTTRVGWSAFLLVLPVIVVAWVYLHPFLDDPTTLPFGVDTPGYIFRTRVVHELGLNALESFGERPGYPIVTSVLLDVTRGDPLDLARVSPAIFSVAIALSAVGLGIGGAGERPWVAAGLGIAIAGSAFVGLTAVGYASNLLFDVSALAAVALWVPVSLGHAGAAAIVLLIVAAAVTHWMLALGLILLLALDTAFLGIVRRARGSHAGHRVSSRRLVGTLAVGMLFGAGAVLLGPELPARGLPTTFHHEARGKIERRLPALALPLTVPVAAAGAVAMLVVGGARRKRMTLPLLLWAAAAPAGLVVWYVLGINAPPYRSAAAALGIPALIVLGAGALCSWPWIRGRSLGAVLGGLLVVASSAWLLSSGARIWERGRSSITAGQLAQTATLGTYLEPLPASTRIAIPVDVDRRRPLRALQAGLAPARYELVTAWPTELRGDPDRLRREMARLPTGTVVVYLDTYHRGRAPEGTELGPGVVLLAGPEPQGTLTAAPIGATSAGALLSVTGVSLAVLLLTGLGWTLLLTDLGPLVAVALAPAMGAAAIVIAGLLVGRLGVPFNGGRGIAVAAVAAASGWMAFVLAHRSRLASHVSRPPEDPEGGPVSEISGR